MGQTMRARPPASDGYPSRDEIEWHIANGRRLRSQAFAEAGQHIREWLGSGMRRLTIAVRRPPEDRRNARSEDVVSALRSPLTAIRSFTEILIDNPHLEPAERSRFLRIVLDEERRLEREIDAMASGRGQPAR